MPVNSSAIDAVSQPVSQSIDCIAVINCISSALLLIFTIISVICAFRAYNHQKDRAKKDAACELAKYYAQDIIGRSAFIIRSLETAKLQDRIKTLFPLEKICRLDRKELEDLLSDAGETFDALLKEMYFLPPFAIYDAKMALASSIEERHCVEDEYFEERTQDENGNPVIKIQRTSLLYNEYSRAIVDLLNNLEWFSMSCRYGLADEKMLYQSLHKTFISQVWLLYFYICKSNETNEDKIYTNLIWLFNLWKDRFTQIQRETADKRSEAEEELKRQEIKLHEAARKVRDVESDIYVGHGLK